MRVTLPVRPILAVTLLSLALAGCGRDRERRSAEPFSPQLATVPSTDERISIDASAFEDALLELRLRLALLEEIGVGALGVELQSRGGEIRLRGSAPSQLQLKRIVDVAEATPGVSHIDCELEVPADPADAIGPLEEARRHLADALLAARARTALVRELGRNGFDLVIEATDSQLTVRGSLTDPSSIETALSAVANVQGVEQVHDELSFDG